MSTKYYREFTSLSWTNPVLIAGLFLASSTLTYFLIFFLFLQPAGANSVSESNIDNPPSMIFAATPDGADIVPLYFDSDRNVMWGSEAPLSNKLYKSTDFGLTWTLVYSFPKRNQLPGGPYNYDNIFAVQVLPTGTILVSAVNQYWSYNGTIYRSTDGGASFERARYANGIGFPDDTPFEYIRGSSTPWAFDHNNEFAIAGTYSYKDPEGLTDRDVWMSNDDGSTWNRIFHVEGNGSVNAKTLHSHMARIDPDGGTWLSFGDHDPGWSHENQVYGLWYSPQSPTIISGEPRADDFGSFTRVYHHSVENNWARIRPVTVIFKNLPSGEKYAYLGEDDMTYYEARTITRLRYDDGSFQTEVTANFTEPFGTTPGHNGPIFGMTQITPEYWVAAAARVAGTNPPSTWALLYSTDGGESWQIDPGHNVPVQYLLPYTVKGRVWGGRPPGDTKGPGYRPPTRIRFDASVISGKEPLSVTFTDHTLSPTGITGWQWDFGDGGFENSQSPSHTYLDDGSYTVTLGVTEKDDWTANLAQPAMVFVENNPPELATPELVTAPEGETTHLTASFTDPGVLDTHSAVVDWGDETVEDATLTENSGSGSISAQHIYRRAGAYTVRLTVMDDDGGISESDRTATIDCTETKPSIFLNLDKVFWSNYNDYKNSLLTVRYQMKNASGAFVNDIEIVGVIATNGVTVSTPLPVFLTDSLDAGASSIFQIKYLLPAGVTSFKTRIYTEASDGCMNTYSYPGPYASS